DATLLRFDRLDIFCANAGILWGIRPGDPAEVIGPDAPDEAWDRIWRVNVLSHVYAARAVVPRMLEQGEGHFVVTASAAALLTILGNAPYAVTKHAALALAGEHLLGTAPVVEPEDVAGAVVDALEDGRFLILPHPEVAEFFRRKATDYDRWLAGMRRLQATTGLG